MRQPLSIGAHFILAFDYQDAIFPEHSIRFLSAFEVQVQNRLVIFDGRILSSVVLVVPLKILVVLVRRTTGSVHVRWVKDHAFY